jgi:hypothetical protein
VNENYTLNPQPGILARLPALTHLTIASNGRELGDIESLLAGLPPTKCLNSLTLEIKKARHFEEGALQSLGAACAVHVRRVAAGEDPNEMVSLVRVAFADVDGDRNERLKVVVC